MQLKQLVTLAKNGGLTCSEVMDLLMDQPTKPQKTQHGWKVESHAHMHAMEGFVLKQSKEMTNWSFEKKQIHWQKPTHLRPESKDAELEYGRYVYASGESGSITAYDGVAQSADRLAPDSTYEERILHPAVDEDCTYTVYKYEKKGEKPVPEEYATLAEIQSLPVGKEPGKYVAESEKKPDTIRYHKKVKIKAVTAQSHTMFPDAESIVMHLTAALLSDAGQIALEHMEKSLKPGEQKTVGLFSKTAVQAVTKADSKIKNRLLAIGLEVDQSQKRDPKTGLYPVAKAKTVKVEEMDIDHVVVVLGYRASGELNVVTCFPSHETTSSTIQTATGATEDIVELQWGKHTKVTQKNALPTLKW